MDHAAVLERLLRWAEQEQNVRVVVLEGSVAVDPSSVDDLSDLDVRLYVTEPQLLYRSPTWFEQFGEVLVVEALEYPGRYSRRLVYYVDGKIDFMIASIASLINKKRFQARVRVLVDKDGLTATIEQGGDVVAASLPNEATFLTCVNQFYGAALMYVRLLVRDEPIKAMYRDWDMKTRLFAMIEWDYLARHGGDLDVAPLGARFYEWADADVIDHLNACWSAGFTPSRDSLTSTVSLFKAASQRVSRVLGLSEFDAEPVEDEIERILDTHAPPSRALNHNASDARSVRVVVPSCPE